MATYKDKHSQFDKIEKAAENKYITYGDSAGPLVMAEIIRKIAVDEILKDCNFVLQYYPKDTANCLNDKFFIVRGAEIAKSLETNVGNNYKFTFYLTEEN